MEPLIKNRLAPKVHARLTCFIAALLVGSLGLGTASAQSADPAQTPLFLTTSVEPNIMFTLDDSGSMQWEFMPDGTGFNYFMFPRPSGLYGGANYPNRVPLFWDNNLTNFYLRSAHSNGVFYDPDNTYRPWIESDVTPFPDADPTCALYNPNNPALGCLDLTETQQADAVWSGNTANTNVFQVSHAAPGLIANFSNISATQSFTPITYFNYTGGNELQRASYQKVEITTAATPATATFTSPGGVTRTRDEEIQNFANWFQYHRSRALAAMGGVGRAFYELADETRVGYGTINQGTNDVDGVNAATIRRGLRSFTAQERENFYDELYGQVINTAFTPLRRAARDVGEYFKRDDDRGPWSESPGVASGEPPTDHLTCRQSFHILMTDGFWNGWDQGLGNVDGSQGPEIQNPEGDTFQYLPTDPFQDGFSDTLADIGMEYWKRDLRPDLANEVPTSAINPAFWQHVTGFGVGLGVEGTISAEDAFAAIDTGDEIQWPNPGNRPFGQNIVNRHSESATIDDLLHFGLNARGGFFSAADPDTFAEGLGEVLREITARTEASATSAAVSSAVIETDTRAYFAGFRSTDWSGTLSGRPIDEDGTVASEGCAECWNAETTLAAQAAANTRNIFTRATGVADLSGSGGGTRFAWGDLDGEQSSALDHASDGMNDGRGAHRVAWLHGETQTGLRSRSGSGSPRLLGDIVNSDPVFQDGVLYVGANGGMLHAFDGETGEELFAYVPSRLLLPEAGADFAPLSRLTALDYADNHRYFVDGKIAVRQVHDGNDLRTILVGSLGAGGRQVFALDVSDPDNFSENDVLWEFSHSEMGASVGTPQIARIQPDGDWAVLFGNGHGSSSHEARLFIVDLFSGDLVKEISTGEGDAASPNGLATPFVTDWPSGGFRADRVYAGDRLGNLWVFDVSRSNTNQWSARLLAQATDPSDTPQPITTSPIGQILDEDRAMISFGTGSFMFGPDANDNQVQSLYGVLDTTTPPSEAAERSDLVLQEIIYETTITTAGGPRDVRVVSDNLVDLTQKRGWVLDLDWDSGERVISNPSTLGRQEKRVRFSTLIPDDDPCGTGRAGFLYDLDLRTGGRVERPVFDLDGDRRFDDDDLVFVPGEGYLPPSGMGFGQGESMTDIIIPPDPDGDDEDRAQLVCDGEGNCEVLRDGDQPLGRMNWQQLR